MTFQEWWDTSGPNGTRREGAIGLAKAAWDAAKTDIHKSVLEHARRYTCKKMRGVAVALADLIKRSG